MPDPSGVEVCELLPDRFEHFDETLRKEATREDGSASPGVPDFVMNLAASEAQRDIHDALHADVFSLLARGWCLAKELHAYTNTMQYPPEQTSIVFLGEHSVSTDLHPVVTLCIGAMRLHPLRFTLTLAANFRSAGLLIRGGYIIGLAAGDCDVSAQLRYGSIDLHKRLESRRVVIPGRTLFEAPGLAIG